MTDEQLNAAIDTAAKHSSDSYGHHRCAELMLKQLAELLAIQLARAKEKSAE